MINKPTNSFEVIILCTRCSDTGIVMSSNRDMWNAAPFAFRCVCGKGQRHSNLPEFPAHDSWVHTHVDSRPTDHWFSVMFNTPDFKANEDFQRRLKIWGKDWFAFKFREWQESKKHEEKTNEEKESG